MMVLYFSGTGNSRYIAAQIAQALCVPTLDLNVRIQAADTSPVQTGPDIVLVTPTYAWRIPRIVEQWLEATPLPQAQRIWFVMDCGSEIGSADHYNRQLAQRKQLRPMGTTPIQMPENYIAMFSAPDPAQARRIVDSAAPAIQQFFVKAGPFRADDRCIGCGQCVQSCPLNNIRLTAGRPVWGSQCTHCMACISYCPTQAIEYGKKSQGQPRYHFETLEQK